MTCSLSACTGYLAPTGCDLTADWTCSACPAKATAAACTAILDRLQTAMDAVAQNPSAEFLESLLRGEEEEDGDWRRVPLTSQFYMDARRSLAYIYQGRKLLSCKVIVRSQFN